MTHNGAKIILNLHLNFWFRYHFIRFSNVKWNILALFNHTNKQVSFFVFFQIFDVDTYSLPPVHITYCMFLVLLLHFFKFPAPARSEKKSSNWCVWIKTRNPAIFARFAKWMKIRQNEMGSISCSAHRSPNFTNPKFQFPQFKVLQSIFFSF